MILGRKIKKDDTVLFASYTYTVIANNSNMCIYDNNFDRILKSSVIKYKKILDSSSKDLSMVFFPDKRISLCEYKEIPDGTLFGLINCGINRSSKDNDHDSFEYKVISNYVCKIPKYIKSSESAFIKYCIMINTLCKDVLLTIMLIILELERVDTSHYIKHKPYKYKHKETSIIVANPPCIFRINNNDLNVTMKCELMI